MDLDETLVERPDGLARVVSSSYIPQRFNGRMLSCSAVIRAAVRLRMRQGQEFEGEPAELSSDMTIVRPLEVGRPLSSAASRKRSAHSGTFILFPFPCNHCTNPAHLPESGQKHKRGCSICRIPDLYHQALMTSRFYEQPLVSPQLKHFRQVPFRTRVNCLQF